MPEKSNLNRPLRKTRCAITDAVSIAIVGQVGIFAAVVFNGILSVKRIKEAKVEASQARADAAEAKIEAAHAKLGLHQQNAKLDEMAAVGTETRILVNSGTRRLLNNIAILSRRMYEANPTPENLESAKDAEQALSDHDINQAILDGPKKEGQE